MNDSYDGEVRLGRKPCTLSIELTRGSRANTKAARARDRRDIAKATAVVARLEKVQEKIVAAVVRQFLAAYNLEWRGDLPALPPDGFRARLELSSVSVWGNGSARLLVKTPAEHVVQARLDKAGKLAEVLLWK
jgi:hypothetical protein